MSDLLIINLILGTPATILVLIFTYFYGVKRLKSLKSPSVDEYLNNSKPPYKGQSRGF